MTSARAGRTVEVLGGADGYSAFVPAPLPPDPPLEITPRRQALLDEGNQALGRLHGLTLLLPDPEQFAHAFVRKEAVASSQIEGTRATLLDLLLFENDLAPGAQRADTEETLNCVAAMEHGLGRVDDLPLSNRLLREVHECLMAGAHGARKSSGEFRRVQNWIGGSRPGTARFVPPPPVEIVPAMGLLEKFLHDDPEPTPALVKAALAHVQFETIHPFVDGNGRVGRLLIAMVLASEGVLPQPLLYLSVYFRRHRQAYYDHLHRVRTHDDWEGWLDFFLQGVIVVADSAIATAREIRASVDRDAATVHGFGRGATTGLRVHQLATQRMVLTAPIVAQRLGLSAPTANGALARLTDAGILREVTGRQRRRIFVYEEYLAALAREA